MNDSNQAVNPTSTAITKAINPDIKPSKDWYDRKEGDKQLMTLEEMNHLDPTALQMLARSAGVTFEEFVTEVTWQDRNRLKVKQLAEQQSRLGFYGSMFAAISYPPKELKSKDGSPVTRWTSTNGRDTLILTGGYRNKMVRKGSRVSFVKNDEGNDIVEPCPLPYGMIPRLFFLYLSRLWKERQQQGIRDRRIDLGFCLKDLCLSIGLTVTGPNYAALSDQISRVLHSSIGYERITEEQAMTHQPQPFAEKTGLVFEQSGEQLSFLPSWFVLSEDMAKVLDDSMPVDLTHLKEFGKDVLAFDLYTWLNWRLFSLHHPVTISYAALYKQFGSNYKRPGDFKVKLKQAWGKVYPLFPPVIDPKMNTIIADCPLKLTQKGVYLTDTPLPVISRTVSKLKAKQFQKIMAGK